ncbi:hypothetical protein B14911_19090 [Bacillus sp. NRRL B-14911]|nr:hypothetical protein B14911_19090 [Bacillus sp. NRRL B-14911]
MALLTSKIVPQRVGESEGREIFGDEGLAGELGLEVGRSGVANILKKLLIKSKSC